MDNEIDQLAVDFEHKRGPFAQANFPEATLVDELGDAYKPEYLSLFCTLDYNRRVDNLVDNILELAEVDDAYGTNYFDPTDVDARLTDDIQALFQSIGFRYPNRDAKGWKQNCIAIANHFGGSWSNLHAASDYHAPTLVDILRDHDFKFIKGVKLAPFYARVVNDFVTELDDVWRLDIPVDTHIRRLSQDLFQDSDMSDDAIRQRWREIGQSFDFSPHVVDGALWQIGYNWDDWGEDYWEAL